MFSGWEEVGRAIGDLHVGEDAVTAILNVGVEMRGVHCLSCLHERVDVFHHCGEIKPDPSLFGVHERIVDAL